MAEWATPDKKKGKGVEPEPIVMPLIAPIVLPTTAPVVVEPETVPARTRR